MGVDVFVKCTASDMMSISFAQVTLITARNSSSRRIISISPSGLANWAIRKR